MILCLNAPDGAGCFPTVEQMKSMMVDGGVSMHLMVLGASRPERNHNVHGTCCVSMHLMVLGASRPAAQGKQ